MWIWIFLSYPDPHQIATLAYRPPRLQFLSLYRSSISIRGCCDADPPNVDADPDPAFHSNMRIRIQLFYFYADSDPAFHSNMRILIWLPLRIRIHKTAL
jgi:hypothetical protein